MNIDPAGFQPAGIFSVFSILTEDFAYADW